MTGLSATELRRPLNWQDFERSTRTLFEVVLDDPGVQMHGRAGQPQAGVDIWGTRNATNELVGVQCKKSDDPISEAELKSEFSKARTFKPRIREFILVTTAPRDAKIQEVARKLTERSGKTSRPIKVVLWGWEDVQEAAATSDKAWRAFDPTFSPFAEQARVEAQKNDATTHAMLAEILALQKASTAASVSNPEEEITTRHGEITAYQNLAKSGNARIALEQLKVLRRNQWSEATASERYRLLTAMAVANLALGNDRASGELLIDAFSEQPSHKNALINKAKGYLFRGEADNAFREATALLQTNPASAEAAGIVIQASSVVAPTTEPSLDKVPEPLRTSPEVQAAVIEHYRRRSDSRWMALARASATDNPANHILVEFGAESVLEEVLRSSPDAVIGGPIAPRLIDDLTTAADTMVRVALDNSANPSTISLPAASNAALALRLLNRLAEAKNVLDTALSRYPDNSNLRLQRAALAMSQDDPGTALSLLPDHPTEDEAAALKIEAFLATNRSQDALLLIAETESLPHSEHMRVVRTAAHLSALLKVDRINEAKSLIDGLVASSPTDLTLKSFQSRVYRLSGNVDDAKSTIHDALSAVGDATPYSARVQIAHEAYDLQLFDETVRLLAGHVATHRPNPILELLLAAAINGNFPNVARDTLSQLLPAVRSIPIYMRMSAVLALNTGDPSAESKIDAYLSIQPGDTAVLLRKAALILRSGREAALKVFLTGLSLSGLRGEPIQKIRLAAFVARFANPRVGLDLGYEILLNNWHDPEVHLAYHGLILLNPNIDPAIPPSDVVAGDYVVTVANPDGSEGRYRIEDIDYTAFSTERIRTNSDLAQLLLGKRVNDRVTIIEGVGRRDITIKSIKHRYLDALHVSMGEFNTRFPRSNRLIAVHIDPQQPLRSFEEMARRRAETVNELLDRYEREGMPLSFIAPLLGESPLAVWEELPKINRKGRVCRGTLAERTDALRALRDRKQSGCVIDAVTALTIRRLGLKDIVERVCGTVHTTSSVVDLFAERALEAKDAVRSKGGSVSWYDNAVRFVDYSRGQLEDSARQHADDHAWIVANFRIAPALPKQDLAGELRKFSERLPNYALDPAIAADASGLLLVSDDMGFRGFAAHYFRVASSWLQPILLTARDTSVLTRDEYGDFVGRLLLLGQKFISLDSATLVEWATRAKFSLTPDIAALIDAVGGSEADIATSAGIAAAFLAEVERDAPTFNCNMLASAVYASLSRGREQIQAAIVDLVQGHMPRATRPTVEHAIAWLRGHTIGHSSHWPTVPELH